MRTHDKINSWLSSINPGDPGLALDRYGHCQLRDGSGALCNVFLPSADDAGFVLYADVWQLRDKPAAETYEDLLALNLAGMCSSGNCLGFDKRLRSLVYYRRQDIAATDLKMFHALVADFFSAAAEMKARLALVFSTSNGVEPGRATAGARKSRIYPRYPAN